jgi:hypothetical protein
MAKKIARKIRTFEGLPVIDAIKDVDLVITKRDTTESKKKDPANCAAALAGRREFKADVRVHITRTYVKDVKNKRWIKFVTPERIQKEIISFDRGASFEPGEYTLKAPFPSMKKGYSPNYSNKTSGRGIKHRLTANIREQAVHK